MLFADAKTEDPYPVWRKNNEKTFEKILHFSPENGFTDAENIDAEEIKIQMAYQHQYITPVVEEKKSRKKKEVLLKIKYI